VAEGEEIVIDPTARILLKVREREPDAVTRALDR